MSRVLVIPDIHAPFQHQDSLDFLAFVKEAWETDECVLLGDELDHAAISRYTKDPEGMGAVDEFTRGMDFMYQLYELIGKKAKVCVSNHGARPFRAAFEAGLPPLFLRQYHDFMDAPKGWEWGEFWEIDGVRYEHGDGFSGMYSFRHVVVARMQSAVIGHIHSNAGVLTLAPDNRRTFFGMNAGCLIDPAAYAFKYGKNARVKVSLGCGVVIDGVPYFIPMLVDDKGRWTGKGVV